MILKQEDNGFIVSESGLYYGEDAIELVKSLTRTIPLLTNRQACEIAVRVFRGETVDVEKLLAEIKP